MAAAERYKFLLRPWLPGGALAGDSTGSRAARGVANAHLGRRQEVGPEAGSGRLEREHGAAACRPGPMAGQTPPGSAFPVQLPRPGLRPAPPGGLTGGDRPGRAPAQSGRGRAEPRPSPEAACSEPQSKLSVSRRYCHGARRWSGAPRGPREAILRARFYGGPQASRRLSGAYCDSRGSCRPREAAMACGGQCAG